MNEVIGTLKVENFQLQSGAIVPNIKLTYKTYGELGKNRENVILYPTSYGAQHSDLEWLIHPKRILNPQKWFIIIPNMLGNGLSTSPSNSDLGIEPNYFTHFDNVRLQEILLTSIFNIEEIALIYGWSMGAQQAYHWGALYPEKVKKIVALCGTAKTTDHNRIFLQSLRSALIGDSTWTGERFAGVPEQGFRTFALIYASWAASQAFYREGIYYQLGYHSLEDYLQRGWEANYRKRDPNNLLSMLDTWLHCDVSNNSIYQGNYEMALGAIKAQTWVVPSSSDLYFTPEDCAKESKLIPNSHYLPIPSIWGHRAGNPYQNPEDEKFIRNILQEIL